MKAVVVAMWILTGACVNWKSTVTIEDQRHIRVAAPSDCESGCEATTGSKLAPAFISCIQQCPGATVLPGACTTAEGAPTATCTDFTWTRQDELDGRCSEFRDRQDVNITGCREERHTTALGYVGAGIGIIFVVLISIAGSAPTH
jgi:hypothetical protein